jgi:hypothetical protein
MSITPFKKIDEIKSKFYSLSKEENTTLKKKNEKKLMKIEKLKKKKSYKTNKTNRCRSYSNCELLKKYFSKLS